MSKKYSTENTIIAFDFHDVLVNYDWTKIMKTFWASKKKLRLFIALLNPLIWWDIIKLMWQEAVSEQYIVSLGQKHKSLEPYIPLGIKIANTQKINYNMLNLSKNLKNSGYELQLFSNIGAIVLQDAIPKFPEIFGLFSKMVVPSKENGYIRKPFDLAFTNYLEINKSSHTNYLHENNSRENNSQVNKKFIFIDDKTKNIKKADQYGILGIRFKNYDQLVQEFKKLCILK